VVRSNKDAWVDAGFTLLRDGGEDALTIERLCAALVKTKGAFYHHFESVDVYLSALLEAWEERNTRDPIAKTEAGETTASRRRALSVAVKRLDSRLDLAVRAWGLRDRRVRERVERVDEMRIQYLASLFPEKVPTRRRELLARLEYAAFLGAQQLDPTFSRRDSRQVERLLVEALAFLERA